MGWCMGVFTSCGKEGMKLTIGSLKQLVHLGMSHVVSHVSTLVVSGLIWYVLAVVWHRGQEKVTKALK